MTDRSRQGEDTHGIRLGKTDSSILFLCAKKYIIPIKKCNINRSLFQISAHEVGIICK